MSDHEQAPAPGRPANPLTWLLDTIGSIWFGVTMLILIFLYSSIGSAVPLVRQGALADSLGLEFLRFEKSEMEWFSWWPFVLLILLFCLAIITVTLRRIRLTVVNAGVWAIHTGIVIMAGACLYYFGTKVEGDAIVFGSLARIRAPGATEATLVIRPQAETVLSGGTRHYRVQVVRIEPDYVPESGPYAGKGRKMQRVSLNVTSMHEGTSFIRRMVVGDPSATEDLVRGVRSGSLVDPDLQIVLDYDPVEHFYHSHELPVQSNGAVYVRPVGEREWVQMRVDWLPHYYERLTNRSELWPTQGESMPPVRHLDQPARKPAQVEWLQNLDFRVTDYLPYAHLESRFVDNGPGAPLNPMVRLRLGDGPRAQEFELLAAIPERSQASLMEGFNIRFTWVGSAADRAELIRPRDPRIKVKVASKNLEKEYQLTQLRSGPVDVEDTGYRLESVRTAGPGELQAGSRGLAIIQVTRAKDSFERVVVAGDDSGGLDMDRLGQAPADPDITFQYFDPMAPGVLLIGGSDAPEVDAVITFQDGRQAQHKAAVGGSLPVFPMAGLKVLEMLPSVRAETRPVIVPRNKRGSLREQGKRQSMVRVEINDGQRIQAAWLEFNDYAFPDAQRCQPGRVTDFRPQRLLLSGGRQVELLYSRQRERLASRVVLDRFILETHPGGDRPADYISMVRFEGANGWSDLQEIRSNQPARHGDYWYFQSRWDPQIEAHTVLGVGNRRGVVAMLAGVCISIAGMIYAFYVKPAIIRRRKQRALELAAVRARPRGSNGSGEPQRAAPTAVGKLPKVPSA